MGIQEFNVLTARDHHVCNVKWLSHVECCRLTFPFSCCPQFLTSEIATGNYSTFHFRHCVVEMVEIFVFLKISIPVFAISGLIPAFCMDFTAAWLSLESMPVGCGMATKTAISWGYHRVIEIYGLILWGLPGITSKLGYSSHWLVAHTHTHIYIYDRFWSTIKWNIYIYKVIPTSQYQCDQTQTIGIQSGDIIGICSA